jgi:uncharacterized protein YheU (UPF0270 family)
VEIPHRTLQAETLRALIEEFITREGTHYGHEVEQTLDDAVAQVTRALDRNEAFVSFDDETETVSIVSRAHGPR